MLLSSICSAGNDLRLGADEAPPPIFSAFIGEELDKLLNNLAQAGDMPTMTKDFLLKLGMDSVPNIRRHNTDRNRTSPFAFTGNKFELRAAGGTANIARPLTALNTIMAEALTEFYARYGTSLQNPKQRSQTLFKCFQDYAKSVRPIIFNGDGYSEQWHKTAKQRGLIHVKGTPQALKDEMNSPSIEVFYKHNIFSPKEAQARYEISLERYTKQVQIEVLTLRELVLSHVLPAAVTYQNTLLANATQLPQLGQENTPFLKTIRIISRSAELLTYQIEQMDQTCNGIDQLNDLEEKAKAYMTQVRAKYFTFIRQQVNILEQVIDNKIWPIVKYRELLFVR